LNNTEQHRLYCECLHWKAEIKKRGANGRTWWNGIKKELKEIRGEAGLEYLLTEMNKK